MIKQVIVMRTDLNMRKGKMIAQGAHASMVFLAEPVASYFGDNSCGDPDCCGGVPPLSLSKEALEWLQGKFTKICVGVDSEAALLGIVEAAEAAGLEVNLIEDSGATEFHGVPTHTCCAIGPNKAEEIDKITGHLKLL